MCVRCQWNNLLANQQTKTTVLMAKGTISHDSDQLELFVRCLHIWLIIDYTASKNCQNSKMPYRPHRCLAINIISPCGRLGTVRDVNVVEK